ncbi:hypothetical protein LOC68_03895 [Blastopirellula sp. JC732]|uniref:Uncharacterized protein n=1 Tax=Blastopirellula sediminis TaxID=2894196 RepID=A0A9X1MJW1_9BACT|nr:hypothetical protein [Blastopirellula sediminis]MCC9609699.1 hypothetical protein [Blastopirellula sediminis]MCC9627525.1 hypothetical protein [Blastopirellula sediminis]
MNAPELNPDDTKMRAGVTAAKLEVQEYTRRKPLDDAGKQLLTRFFMGAYFPSWTAPASWAHVDVKRHDFMRNFNGSLDVQATTKKELSRLTLQAMSEMIKPDYHPVVRYNAMLLIGDLNAQEYDLRTNAPVCPYHASLDVMLKVLEDPNADDVVKVGAMLGVLRHARFAQSLPKPSGEAVTIADIERMTKAAAQVITSDVAEGRSADAHQWTQRRAMDLVRTLSPGYQQMFKSGGNQNASGEIRKSLEEVAKSLGKMIENENADKSLRVDAALTLAAMPSDDAVKKSFDPNVQVGLVAKLASKSVDDDITWFTEKLKEMKMGGPGGPGGMGGPGGYGMEGYSAMPAMEYGGGSGYGDEAMMGPDGKPMKPKKKEFVNTNPPLHSLQLTFRRRVKADVDSLKVSLVGNDAKADDIRNLSSGLIRFVPSAEEQAAIIDLAKAMDELIVAADTDTTASTTPMNSPMGFQTSTAPMDPFLPYEDLAKAVKDKQAKVERLANKLAAGAGVVEDAAGEAVVPSADMPFGAVPGMAPAGAAPAAAPKGPVAPAGGKPAAPMTPTADMPFGPVPGAAPAAGRATPMPMGPMP